MGGSNIVVVATEQTMIGEVEVSLLRVPSDVIGSDRVLGSAIPSVCGRVLVVSSVFSNPASASDPASCPSTPSMVTGSSTDRKSVV